MLSLCHVAILPRKFGKTSLLKSEIFLLLSMSVSETELERSVMINKINQVRAEGCRCGNRNMPAVGKVEWSETLEKSAQSHASEMEKYEYFSHY